MTKPTRTDDLVEIQQLLARYAVTITQEDIDGLIGVFTPDGTYSAFGDTYRLDKFPELVTAAPKGLFLTGAAVVDIDGDSASGTQPLCFIDHATHDMRIGYYRDTYSRTADGTFTHGSIPLRYLWPSELDLMARIAGLTLRDRWSTWTREPFTRLSTKHISVWQRPA